MMIGLCNSKFDINYKRFIRAYLRYYSNALCFLHLQPLFGICSRLVHRKLIHSIKGSHKNKETSLLNFCIFPKTLDHAVNNTMYCVRVVVLRSVYLCKNFPRRRGRSFCGKKTGHRSLLSRPWIKMERIYPLLDV